MDRFRVPEQYIALSQSRCTAFKVLAFDDVFDELLITVVVECYIEIATVPQHVDFVAAGINEKAARPEWHLLKRKRMICIQERSVQW